MEELLGLQNRVPNVTVVGTLYSLLLLVSMVVYSWFRYVRRIICCVNICFCGGVFKRRLIPYDGFWMTGVGGNNTSTFPEGFHKGRYCICFYHCGLYGNQDLISPCSDDIRYLM